MPFGLQSDSESELESGFENVNKPLEVLSAGLSIRTLSIKLQIKTLLDNEIT